MKKYIYIFFATILIFLYSCKTVNLMDKNAVKNLPDSYSSVKDSANSAAINWKQFFSDPNLLELIDVGLKNNLDLSIALQKMEVAKANVRMNTGALFPNLDANIGASQKKFGLYTMDGAGNITTEITPGQLIPIHLPDYYLGLQTSWEIDVWGKLRNKRKAALLRYLSSAEGKNLVITNLVADIANAYYELLALDNELEIIKEAIQLQENAFEMIKIQKEAGVANELAVKQFEAQLLNTKALEYETSQKIVVVENQINFLLNRYPQAVKREKTVLTKDLPVKINVGIPSDLLKNRPDIKQAEYELMASKADVKAAKAAFYPALNITGAMGYQAFNTGYLFTSPESMAYSLIGSLAAPLINRNAIKAEFKTANAMQLDALYNYQKSVLTGYTEVYNQIAGIKNLEKIQEYKNSEVNALAQANEISSELYKSGKANYVEVLMTQSSSLESRLQLINTKQLQFQSVINIYKALGGGWQ